MQSGGSVNQHIKSFWSRFNASAVVSAIGVVPGPAEGLREGRVEGPSDVRQPVIFGISGAVPSIPFLTGRQVFVEMGGNAGNLAFVYALRQQLAGWGDPANVSWQALPAELKRAGDVCVIPCANQFGPRFDLGWLADRLAKADIPLVAVGLGAQSGLNLQIPVVPDGTVRWLRTIAEHAIGDATNISVRGDFTRRVLQAYGFEDVCVTGCPSLFLNPSAALGQSIAARAQDRAGGFKSPARSVRVAVAAGHPGWRHLGRVESSLARIVTETRGAYICQAPLEMVLLGRGDVDELDPSQLDSCREYIDPECGSDDFRVWVRRHAVTFGDMSGWIEFLRRFDFVVGTRVHGTALGLQAGVPALCIAPDSRTLELCQTMGLPYVRAPEVRDGVDLAGLFHRFLDGFDANRFDANRRQLARSYRAFLEGNGLTVTAALRQLAP